jgi:hypothetical protein
MISLAIGISSGILIVLIFTVLKNLDKKLIYGLILSGIGFLYVGFVWKDLQAVVVNSIQAIIFLFIAYYGVRRSLYVLAAGYLLHGCWDLVFNLFEERKLIPPGYDLFCSSLDFIIGIYILLFNKQFSKREFA